MENSHLGVRLGDRRGFDGPALPARIASRLFRLARGVIARIRQAKAFVAGCLIGTSIWTPVFFGSAPDEAELQQYGLPLALALFGAGVWLLQIGKPWRRSKDTRQRDPAGPSRPGMDRVAT